MRVIPKPDLSIEDIYDLCVGGIGNASVRNRFIRYRNGIIEAANEYESRAENSDLYLMPVYGSGGATVPLVTKQELKGLYVNQMAKKNRPGRDVYERLRNVAPGGMCPFCGISSARTLDHVMPKAHYPDLTVLPINLVPCCRDCNTEKLDEKITSIESQKIHPYFDDLTDKQWLYADVVDFGGPVVSFRVEPPEYWDIKNKYKVESHLNTYNLSNRYGDLANGEIIGIRFQMIGLFESGGAVAVKSELEGRARSHAVVHLNSWQTAMNQALAASAWYCSGGFI
jgi:hypothetical protein